MDALPPFVRAERAALLAEIEAAFDRVSREGGVSWSQSAVIDAYGGWPLEPENDARWQDLLDDPGWEPCPGLGGFGFLDPIGFRYYLPVQMTRCVREGSDEGNIPIAWRLGGMRSGFEPRDEARWSLFDPRQRRCVKRFLQYMDVVDPYSTEAFGPSQWWDALENYWKNVPDDEPTASLP